MDTAGSDEAEVIFSGIENPYGIEKNIQEKLH